MKKNSIIVSIILTILFITMVILLKTNKIGCIDNFLSFIFVDNLRKYNLKLFFEIMTFLGSIYTYIIIVVVSFIVFHNKKISMYMIMNVGMSALLMKIIKYIIRRPRPYGIALINETGYGFPSGHALNAMVFYGFIIYLVNHYVKNNLIKKISYLLILLILFIGISRIYLGVHYGSDVLAGYIFGALYLILFINFIFKKEIKVKIK